MHKNFMASLEDYLPAQESIQFQDDTFFKDLTASFERLRKAKSDESAFSEETGALSSIIKHHTGLNLVYEFGFQGPAVDVPDVHKNSPLVSGWRRGWLNNADGQRMVANADGLVRGSVNLKTGRVSGCWEEITSRIFFPTEMVHTSRFSAEECAGVTLHEVGHLITYYEYITRMVTTNQVLSGVARGIEQSSTQQERETVLLSAKKALKLSELDVEALAKTNSSKAAEIVILNALAVETASELGSNIYDANNWEYLADQYAARMGAARPLATALEKIYRGSNNISFRNTPMFLAMEAVKIIMLFGGMFVMPAVSFIGLILILTDGPGDETYDRPGVRIKRVRNQIMEQLKDRKLSKEDVVTLQEDLAALDDMLEKINDRLQFFTWVAKAFSKNLRGRLKAEQVQQELESLVANDLFNSAASLRNMAQ